MAIMTLTLLPVLLVMLLMLTLAICVAVFVYKDAVSRGCPVSCGRRWPCWCRGWWAC